MSYAHLNMDVASLPLSVEAHAKDFARLATLPHHKQGTSNTSDLLKSSDLCKYQ